MRQVGELLEFYRAEPWGYDAIDTRNALLALVVAQGAGMKDNAGRPLKLDTFRLRPPRVDAALKGYELANQVRAIFKVPRT
jgi:hypothetical protein